MKNGSHTSTTSTLPTSSGGGHVLTILQKKSKGLASHPLLVIVHSLQIRAFSNFVFPLEEPMVSVFKPCLDVKVCDLKIKIS